MIFKDGKFPRSRSQYQPTATLFSQQAGQSRIQLLQPLELRLPPPQAGEEQMSSAPGDDKRRDPLPNFNNCARQPLS